MLDEMFYLNFIRKSRVKWNSCKVKQEFHNFLYISSVNLTSVEYYNPNKYLWAFRFWATLLFKYFCMSIIYCYKFKVAGNEIWKGKKTKLGYLLQKSGKLWSISCKNVIQHKVNTPYIYVQHEKWQNFYTLKLARPVANF